MNFLYDSMRDKMRLIEEIEKNHKDLIRNSLNKMQSFLVDKGIAPARKEVKSLPRIEIKGTHENGKERLIREEVEKKYNINELESSDGFNTYYPPIHTGVIKSKTLHNGTYYTMFKITGETETDFDFDILEFRFFNDVFYLNYIISLLGVQKKSPFSPIKNSYATIQEFFVDQFSDEQRAEFTKEEMDAIGDATPSGADIDIEIEAICTTTLSVFRVVNFILEKNKKGNTNQNEYFYDNEYFSIRKWDNDKIQETVIKERKEFDVNYINEILQIDNGFRVLRTHSLGTVINELVKQMQISTFYVAVGFVFESGLKMLSTVFDEVTRVGNMCELIVGALQNYDSELANNKINRETVHSLNNLLLTKCIRLYTYRPSFYHGKFYYMCNKEKAYVIIGSSNISKPAFQKNYELDVIYVMDRGGVQDRQFREWYFDLKSESEEIQSLDEQKFSEYNWNSELDVYPFLRNSIVSKSEMQRRIDQLTDEETRYRLNLWMSKCPTDIYEDINIEAFNGYIMFVYLSEKLVVFESFIPSNAYYVFRISENLMNLMADISTNTKMQMSLSACYVSRGYHILSRENLEKKINNLFKIAK